MIIFLYFFGLKFFKLLEAKYFLMLWMPTQEVKLWEKLLRSFRLFELQVDPNNASLSISTQRDRLQREWNECAIFFAKFSCIQLHFFGFSNPRCDFLAVITHSLSTTLAVKYTNTGWSSKFWIGYLAIFWVSFLLFVTFVNNKQTAVNQTNSSPRVNK